MNILVFGAGAVGSYVGGHMARAGHSVTLVMRPDSAEIIAKRGLTIIEAKGKPFTVYPYASPSLRAAVATGTRFDLIALGMKSYDLKAALVEMQAVSAVTPPLLTLQNGIGIEERVREQLMPAELIAGSLTTPVRRNEDGVIVVEKSGRGLGIAPTQRGQSIKTWFDLLRETQLKTVQCADHRSMKWSKALLNIIGNASAAILGWHPARIYEHDGLFDMETAMLRETLAVMKRLKINVVDLPGSPARQLAAGLRYAPRSMLKPVLVKMVGSGRGDKMPSFHIDLSAGKRQSEVLYHNGAIARAGWEHNVPVPVNTTLTEILLQLVKKPALRSTYRDQPEQLLAVVARRRAMESVR